MAKPELLLLYPDLPSQVLDLLQAGTTVVGPLGQRDDWQGCLATAHAVITGVEYQFTGPVLDRAPRLRVIGRPGIGVDNVDLSAATERGICVVNTPDAPTEPVAEKVVGWMISLAHRLAPADRVAREEGWANKNTLRGHDLLGKTLGLIGLGRVGSRVAQICSRGLGMRAVAFDPYTAAGRARDLGVELTSFEKVVKTSDFLSVHCPLTNETRGLIGERELRAMKPSAYLINSARAPIVVEAALVQALREGWIAGAALDVMMPEPPPPNHPLLKMDNVILAPHIGSFTAEGVMRMSVESAEQVLMVLKGERPLHLVNQTVWDKRRAA